MACHYRHLIIYVTLSHLMQWGLTALIRACESGHVEVAKALLEKGAAPDLKDGVSKAYYGNASACTTITTLPSLTSSNPNYTNYSSSMATV